MTKTALKLAEGPIEGAGPPIEMVSIRQLYLASEAPKGANLQIRDSGRGSPMTDAELKASIYTKGVIYPLLFKRVEDRKYVVAGNRRLRFLREIFADALDSRVQTQDVDKFEGDWREVAMDTNVALPPHLVERYEVIVALTKDLKLSPEDARLRWGLTQKQFSQVMALGKMSETIRAAWKNSEIDAKTAQAFTLEPDPKEQDKILAAVKKSAWNGRFDAGDVSSKIIPANQREAGKLVAFVGVETCKKAKIIKQEDLFSTNHLVTDMKSLNKLAGDKIAAQCDDLVKDGWAWATRKDQVKDPYYHGTIEPSKKTDATAEEAARLREIESAMNSEEEHSADYFEQLEDEEITIKESIKARGFTPEQRKKAGCFISIGHSGELVIEYGKVKPKEVASVKASERAATTKAKKKANSKPGDVTLTNALAERLSRQLQIAGAEALKSDHAVATSAIIAAISCSGHLLNIRVGGEVRERKASGFAEVFSGALASTPQQREAMFAQIASQALSIVVFNGAGKMPLDDEGLVDVFEAMNGARVTKAIFDAFDPKDYFASVNAGAVVDAVRCSMGDDHAAKVAKMKKPDAAKFAAANLKDYLPPQLRTPWYTGPVESEPAKAAKKDKKPKPIKKATTKKRRK